MNSHHYENQPGQNVDNGGQDEEDTGEACMGLIAHAGIDRCC